MLAISGDQYVLLLNVVASVFLTLFNRLLLHGSLFPFPTLLTSLHFLFGGSCTFCWQKIMNNQEESWPDPQNRLLFPLVVLTAGNVALLNISLMINTLSFYQISKLVMLPMTGVIQFLVFREDIPMRLWQAGVLVLVGSGLVTINDYEMNISLPGALISLAAVFLGSIQQLLIRQVQASNLLTNKQLMLYILPSAGIILALCAPMIDHSLSGIGIMADHARHLKPIAAVMISCTGSVFVNLTTCLCLNNLTAFEFQVRLKTLSPIIADPPLE
jgi:solute carrier family 35 protein E3